jgi:outer membrane lipoprotein-sorting protein
MEIIQRYIMKEKLIFLAIFMSLLIAGCVQQPEMRPENETLYIRGHVYGASGGPLQYAFVEATCKSDGLEWDTFYYTDKDGGFELRMQDRMGFCILNASFMHAAATDVVMLDRGTDDLVITLNVSADDARNGSIEGHITSLSLAPINGATVEESFNGVRAVTDENGYYRLDNIKPGQIQVVITAQGYEMAIINSDMKAGQRKHLNYSASRTGTGAGYISGIVTYNNTAVEGAEVITLAGGEVKNTTTNGSGYYEFRNVPTGDDYRVMAFKEGLYPSGRAIKVSSGVTTRADITINSIQFGAYIGGFVFDKDGNPLKKATHRIKLVPYINDTVHVDSTGYYDRGGLVHSQWPVTVTVEVSAGGYRTKREIFTIINGTYYVKHYDLLKEIEKSE